MFGLLPQLGNLVPTDQDPTATFTETETRRRLRQLTAVLLETMGGPPVYAKLLGQLLDRLSDSQCEGFVVHLGRVHVFLVTGEMPADDTPA